MEADTGSTRVQRTPCWQQRHRQKQRHKHQNEDLPYLEQQEHDEQRKYHPHNRPEWNFRPRNDLLRFRGLVLHTQDRVDARKRIAFAVLNGRLGHLGLKLNRFVVVGCGEIGFIVIRL
jgi:hypothetical protein